MKIHEYQAKVILRGYGVAVPRGKLVQSAEESVAAARELMAGGKGVAVVKAQIHAGGRGKGGGVKLARSPEEAGEIFKRIMGVQLVTHQTGPQGQEVRKVYHDDHALCRHKGLAWRRDPDEEDPREAQAKEHDLSYVGLEGNIGCMVNGAGLAMSTMDMIKLAGGQPANFLDVGGGADEEKVTAAFKLLLADPQVKAVLVNIFGGIMKCDVIAAGIIAAAKQVHLGVPLVVRLEGTNVEQGKALLASSGLPIISADDLGDAARKAVKAAG